jgi:mRNA-degrading endonuclease toxin of MazEF toxin-antitoxin module
MPISPTQVINQREMWFCEPDPKDTVGSEQEKDRIWVIVSIARLHRGNCVVGVPLTSKNKAGAHLIQIPAAEFQMDGGRSAITSVALTDQIRTLDKSRFRCKAGTISTRGLDAIMLGLDRLLGR